MLSVKHSVWPCRTLIFRPFAALNAVHNNMALNHQGMATYAISPVVVVSVVRDLGKYGTVPMGSVGVGRCAILCASRIQKLWVAVGPLNRLRQSDQYQEFLNLS